LRNTLKVDVIVVASELELANNIVLAERTPGIDVILSGDMHELTTQPIVASTGTIIVEEGQDGGAVGELTLTVREGRVRHWAWTSHAVTDSIAEHPAVAARVTAVRAAFLAGPRLDVTLRNPVTGAALGAPIDEVVGYTAVPLHRSNPATAALPAVLEGSSHDFLTDAFRVMTGADIGLIRGFRFGTHVRPGPITRADLYHYLPVGAQVARVDGVSGTVILRQLEASLGGALDADPGRWTGGWFVGTSGLEIEVEPYRPTGERVRSVRVNGAPLDTTGARRYSVAGLWFASEPRAVSNCGPCVARGAAPRTFGDEPTDAVEVVARYLASRPDSVASPVLGRVRLLRPLPAPKHGFPVLQPLGGVAAGGARERNAAGQRPPPLAH
jgi:2',3'-cyclic-nucleotide 2'-phosphodiesterase (5'-nucleotidase family)